VTTASRATRAGAVRETMRQAARLDRDWQRKVPEDDRRYAPWMPFSVPAFTALLAEAMPEADGDRFLDIGCGPGSKLLIARDVFGLDAHGFDRNGEYVAAARSLGLSAEIADAETYAGYGRPDILWFNRVARDPEIQARIEAAIWRGMGEGALVICASLEAPPPARWFPVLDDWEIRRGIWMKPHRASAGW
jgi:SAM-dependent methyltransferase